MVIEVSEEHYASIMRVIHVLPRRLKKLDIAFGKLKIS
jgi:hypothetical protein